MPWVGGAVTSSLDIALPPYDPAKDFTSIGLTAEAPGNVAVITGERSGFPLPAELFARAVAFAISQPEDVDVDEMLFRPTR